ncbi:unnamed protein product [Brassica rapa]|uniref:Uncharacterized protein n=2 Tax=Brassica TaxID=3705 RepID=A0A3P6B1W3_BRACM|nr:unnamed protein product [Brassica napus]CAG7894476.1 unnamed protein product [Brassica rapa]VDC90318.1 unnamed protein product [Brassica rapa]
MHVVVLLLDLTFLPLSVYTDFVFCHVILNKIEKDEVI